MRGPLLLALLAVAPRFLGPPLKKPDAGPPDAGPAPSAPLRPGDLAPSFGVPVEPGAKAVLVVFGDPEPKILELYTKYRPSGLQVVAVGVDRAPVLAVPDGEGAIARSYRGERAGAPRLFLVGADGKVRFITSNAAALDREIELALRN